MIWLAIGLVWVVAAGLAWAFFAGASIARNTRHKDDLRSIERGLQAGREAQRDTRTPDQKVRDNDGAWQ